MVSKVEEAMKRKQQQNQQQQQQKQQQQNQQQKQIIQCNKGKSGSKFKRSSSSLEEDGASSAILFLACIACAPSYA